MTKKNKEEKTRGVVMFAFGSRSYYYAAYNMAFSIKAHSPNVQILILTDSKSRFEFDLKGRIDVFDEIIEIENELLYEGVTKVFSPAKVKLSLFKFLKFDYNIYLDVDGICLKDINPLFDELIEQGKSYSSHTVGYHTIKEGKDILSMQWAYADTIWEHYHLKKEAVLPAINSSLQFIIKDDNSERLYIKALELFENPIPLEKLRMKWGGGQPDELYMNIAMAILEIDPSMSGGCSLDNSENGHIHFCRAYNDFAGFQPIVDNFYFQSYYGGVAFTPDTILKWLDTILRKLMSKKGKDHIFKLNQIIKDKHANKK